LSVKHCGAKYIKAHAMPEPTNELAGIFGLAGEW
jgi:hypothetical protein